jgi:hypothetical protein
MDMNQKRNKELKKKRTVPFLNYTVRDFSDYSEISSMPETQKIVFDNLIDAINFSIQKKKEYAEIFKVSEDNSVSLSKDNWVPAVEKAIEFYAELEDYEKCKQCKDIIQTVSYEKGIRSTE